MDGTAITISKVQAFSSFSLEGGGLFQIQLKVFGCTQVLEPILGFKTSLAKNTTIVFLKYTGHASIIVKGTVKLFIDFAEKDIPIHYRKET